MRPDAYGICLPKQTASGEQSVTSPSKIEGFRVFEADLSALLSPFSVDFIQITVNGDLIDAHFSSYLFYTSLHKKDSLVFHRADSFDTFISGGLIRDAFQNVIDERRNHRRNIFFFRNPGHRCLAAGRA